MAIFTLPESFPGTQFRLGWPKFTTLHDRILNYDQQASHCAMWLLVSDSTCACMQLKSHTEVSDKQTTETQLKLLQQLFVCYNFISALLHLLNLLVVFWNILYWHVSSYIVDSMTTLKFYFYKTQPSFLSSVRLPFLPFVFPPGLAQTFLLPGCKPLEYSLNAACLKLSGFLLWVRWKTPNFYIYGL